MTAPTPRGFRSHTANVGIKDDTPDFLVVASDVPCAVAAVFTKSRFAGSPVEVSRAHAADGTAQAVACISKNANVATGEGGHADTRALAAGVAGALGLADDQVLVAGTGVIGVRWPMDLVGAHVKGLAGAFGPLDVEAAARAIMTTDTHPKAASEAVGDATIVGIAKGVGMIEPDMATLLAFFFTDAEVDAATLRSTFRAVVDRTFNSISIDTDTSTSDTAAILANGLAGPVDDAEFAAALGRVAHALTMMIVKDGEGATKLIEVRVDGARDDAQAKRVAKLVANSPLVKTAVHGADPNWGRVAMAIGKAQDDLDIAPERTTIRFGAVEVYPEPMGAARLDEVQALLEGDEVTIGVSLGIGSGAATVWGCDLSDGYVRINADYTT
jgi:glutamate N-acetyltransferase/amino-acid N-acetyltransferase